MREPIRGAAVQKGGGRQKSACQHGRTALATAACALLLVLAPQNAHGQDARPDEGRSQPPSPPQTLGAGDPVQGTEAPGYIAFTFDDGPRESTTPQILAALAEYDVPATFFVVTRKLAGKSGARRRDILDTIIADGHIVGSHTVSHPNLGLVDEKTLVREIDGSLEALSQRLGMAVEIFRPPFGVLPAGGVQRLRRAGVTDIRWNIDARDFFTPSARELRRKVSTSIANSPGAVVLLHDTKNSTARALPGILDDLEALNCARLKAGTAPLLPVSLHYFLHDRGVPRPVPADVAERTATYRDNLPARCARRP